uniref:Uncharacterized protein n=1 Tax=Physcomitrium patens TaxID=3218 RepID=A0A2K1IDQ2_PHYPA|nr:hypothetical protein PHYPA_029554 [Physcomitrium patens]
MALFPVTTFVMEREGFHHDLEESPIQNLLPIEEAIRLLLCSNFPELLAMWAATPKHSPGMFLRVTQVETLKHVGHATLKPEIRECRMQVFHQDLCNVNVRTF